MSKGCRWRIRDGKRVRILHDSWILGEKEVAVTQDPLSLHFETATVDSLIGHPAMSWNFQNIHALFNPLVASSILKIPLSPTTSYANKWIWNEEKNGRFSVRNAYQLIQRNLLVVSCECSTYRNPTHFWRILWKLPIPRKIHLFAWRACREYLPCLQNLQRRHVPG